MFNFEGGCYAKVIRLSPVHEPQIFNAIRFGSILENVIIDPVTRAIDWDDDSITENTRATYPVSHIPGAIETGLGGMPRNIFLLACDADGRLTSVMPSKACLLTLARATRAPGRSLTLALAAAAPFVGCGGQTQAPAGQPTARQSPTTRAASRPAVIISDRAGPSWKGVRRAGRAGHHDADQGGVPGLSVPDPRPHRARPVALRVWAHPGAHEQGASAHRRHAHHPRRQRVPQPDRERAGAHRGRTAALPHRRGPQEEPRRHPGAVEVDEALFSDVMGDMVRFQRKVAERIQAELGLRARVTLVEPGANARTAGATRRVLDLRQRD